MAAKVLMHNYISGDELVLSLSDTRESPVEVQMRKRLGGFTSYLEKYYKDIPVHEVIIDKHNASNNHEIMSRFFLKHPEASLGAVFNSRIYLVGDYLREKNRKMKSLIGYDLLTRNVELMKTDYVTSLIGQRPGLQGYFGVRSEEVV